MLRVQGSAAAVVVVRKRSQAALRQSGVADWLGVEDGGAAGLGCKGNCR